MISDRPIGLFLSGGVDSTAVLGLTSQFASGPVNTFSSGFKVNQEQEKYNVDFNLARLTSRHYATNHHELLISGNDARDNLEKIIWHLEEPVANPSKVPLYLLAKYAKNQVAVVLGGNGGDEIFGGYKRYYFSEQLDRFQKLPAILSHNILPWFLSSLSQKDNLAQKLKTPPGLARFLLFMTQNQPNLGKVFKQEIRLSDIKQFLANKYPENIFKDKTKYLMHLDLSIWLPDESLIRFDKMTMAHGLEHRVPILDHRLVEFAFRIPTSYKVQGKKKNKMIFRQAMAEYLPAYIQNQKKRGWFSPGAKWLRTSLKEMAYTALSPSYCSATSQYFDFNSARRMLDKHITGEKYNLDIIWSLMTFQIWAKIFIDKQL